MLSIRQNGHDNQPAIVFLHAIATSGWMWERFFPELSGYRCIAIDLPGHGLSRSAPWRSMEDVADQVADTIQSVTRGKGCYLVGLSLGAYVGLTLIARHPAAVHRAVLSGINVLPLPHKGLMTLFGYATAPLLKFRYMIDMNAKALKIPPEHVEEYRSSVRQLVLKEYLAASRDAGNFTTPAGLSQSSVPTLLTVGSDEHSLIRRSMEQLAATLPNAELLVIENGGHGWPGAFPNRFTNVVSTWCGHGELP